MAQVETITLYFCEGAVPTAADVTRIALIPGIVHIRNVAEDTDATYVEGADAVTGAPGVTIPAKYDAVPRKSPEKPLSLEIVPNNPTYDLSDVEHGDLRAIARFMDGTAIDVTTLCDWESATGATGTIGAATGIFTPVGVGTTVITARYDWAAVGEPGAAYASGVLTFVTAPDVDDAVVVGDITYTWKATPAATGSATAVQVKTETSAANAARNLMHAINGSAFGIGEGYMSSDAPVNAKARATVNALVLTATAKAIGTVGNAVATTQTGDEATWGGAVMSGGLDATAEATDTTTVTVAA